MTIQRDEGCFWAACDVCADSCDLSAESFTEAVEEIEEAGWIVQKTDGEWSHLCPACKEDAGL